MQLLRLEIAAAPLWIFISSPFSFARISIWPSTKIFFFTFHCTGTFQERRGIVFSPKNSIFVNKIFDLLLSHVHVYVFSIFCALYSIYILCCAAICVVHMPFHISAIIIFSALCETQRDDWREIFVRNFSLIFAFFRRVFYIIQFIDYLHAFFTRFSTFFH